MTLRVCKFYYLLSGVSVTSASQILGHFGICGDKYHNEKSQTDFPARGPGMYMLQLIFYLR